MLTSPQGSSSNFAAAGGEATHKLVTAELPPTNVDLYFEDTQSLAYAEHNFVKNIGWSKTCKKATFGELNAGDYGAKGLPHNNMPPYVAVGAHVRAG